MREDQEEEKRKREEFELELICKRDLQRVCLSNSLHLQGYKEKDFFKQKTYYRFIYFLIFSLYLFEGYF